MSRYPALSDILSRLAADNGMRLRPDSVFPPNAADLEATAARLSVEERCILAGGEEEEQRAVLRKYGTAGKVLDTFLADVFDGALSDVFFAS